jgi:hypothetical protein
VIKPATPPDKGCFLIRPSEKRKPEVSRFILTLKTWSSGSDHR